MSMGIVEALKRRETVLRYGYVLTLKKTEKTPRINPGDSQLLEAVTTSERKEEASNADNK